MSAGSQLQVAVLWPWLLMATLQVGLGYTGLAVAAAVESERLSAQKAIIRVIPLKMEPITLEGVFANVAEVTPAEGKLLQFHPLSLCNTSEDEHTGPGFVSIVKLERPERDLHPCLSLANKAKLAGERGARAILFDITDDESAAEQVWIPSSKLPLSPPALKCILPRCKASCQPLTVVSLQLRKPKGFSHPVVLIWGHDAELLMRVVNNNREAHVKIEVKEPATWPNYDVWIFVTVLSTVLAIVLIFIVRTRCQPTRTQDSLQQQTMQAISQLATRRYQTRSRQAPTRDSASSCSSAPICAICLEEFSEGQELRIISCFHEFHRECVDPWLQQHHTCPLCMFNIIGRAKPDMELPRHLEPGQQLHLFRQHPGNAMYHLSQVHSQGTPRNCASLLSHAPRFFHSQELSQVDLGSMHYLPYRPVSSEPWCGHQPATAQAHRKSPLCGQTPSSRWQPHSSGSGESYLTEHSGYLADGPGSDSSSGPCHGSSSDSMLNCTDVSLQAIHGSCSTFRSSLSSNYDPLVYCSSEGPATEPSPPQQDPRPKSLDLMIASSTALAKSQVFSHVHYHHHHRHHHYERGQAGLNSRPRQEPTQRKPKPSGMKAQKRTEKMQPCQQLQDSGSPSQDAPLHQGHDLSRTVASSTDGPDFSWGGSRQAGAAGPLLSQPFHSPHHRRKEKCHPEPCLAHLPEDSDCNIQIHHGHPSSYCCSPEAQPLIHLMGDPILSLTYPHDPNSSKDVLWNILNINQDFDPTWDPNPSLGKPSPREVLCTLPAS
uniref:RING-type E3 ubiquitin transferase n=1 Tax=Sphenodon punctatus TaxID=8508 RepID=A0A8D0GA42_SPHPU